MMRHELVGPEASHVGRDVVRFRCTCGGWSRSVRQDRADVATVRASHEQHASEDAALEAYSTALQRMPYQLAKPYKGRYKPLLRVRPEVASSFPPRDLEPEWPVQVVRAIDGASWRCPRGYTRARAPPVREVLQHG